MRVAPERLRGWLTRFSASHGAVTSTVTAAQVVVSATDGAVARLGLTWGPLAADGDPLDALIVQATAAHRFGVLLVRKGAHAVALFDSTTMVCHRRGTHYVQGRTKAGGWSQPRYARRRQNQAERSYAKAAEDAAAVLLGRAGIEALFTGGDGAGIAAVLATPSLAPLGQLPRPEPRVLPVADPTVAVLREFGERVRSVPIILNEAARVRPSTPQRDDRSGDQAD